jgi:hypothetical protein
MLMVITSFPCWSRTQQIRLNTLVKFEPAEPLFGGQFSTGANRMGVSLAGVPLLAAAEGGEGD